MIGRIEMLLFADEAQVRVIRRVDVFQSIPDGAIKAAVRIHQQTCQQHPFLRKQTEGDNNNSDSFVMAEVVQSGTNFSVNQVPHGKSIRQKKVEDKQVAEGKRQLMDEKQGEAKLRQFLQGKHFFHFSELVFFRYQVKVET